ncbi:hypothetical protein [Tunturiibacter lichenicola]|uniref:hypothetical protein n=1 Tax=Tunturiibacter lichenicola TaxID=2051959 RepID=UPI003D9B79FB
MTYMKPLPIFNLPNPHDELSVAAHKTAVLDFYDDLFKDVDAALRDALPKVLSIFGLYEGPVDLAVHAPNTRYLVRQSLEKKSGIARDEDEVFFDMMRVSNCGLCVKTAYGEIRVLKAPSDGLPKATSDARVRFITNNQMAFSFAEDAASKPPSLNIFILWRMDAEFKYIGMDIACPRRTHDKGDIDCYWITKWNGENTIQLVEPIRTVTADLDEITALPIDETKSKN